MSDLVLQGGQQDAFLLKPVHILDVQLQDTPGGQQVFRPEQGRGRLSAYTVRVAQ
jgi:hypothetical protein